jgi:hypothetical protein
MDNTQEILNQYLLKMLEAVEKGAELAANEIPSILTEYVMYNAVYYWTLTFISILAGTYAYRAAVKAARIIEKDKDPSVQIVSGFFSGAFSLIVFFSSVFDAVQATFFPRVFLLEKALHLVQCS